MKFINERTALAVVAIIFIIKGIVDWNIKPFYVVLTDFVVSFIAMRILKYKFDVYLNKRYRGGENYGKQS